MDQKKAEELEQKLRKNKFTLQDFYDQLVQLKSMGSITDILGMMPGVNASALKNVQVDEKALSHTEAIILSMTPYERENPSCISHSRKQRISKGAGVTVQEINSLLKQFDDMQKLMKQFTGPGAGKKLKKLQKKGGFGGMGGFGGFR
jgi:signal recognition particle subunit SRP54